MITSLDGFIRNPSCQYLSGKLGAVVFSIQNGKITTDNSETAAFLSKAKCGTLKHIKLNKK